MDAIAARLELAQEVAREAGAQALDFFRRRDELLIESKANPQDIVSRADGEIEALIRDRLAAAFPEDGFLGEELGETTGASGCVWVLDPIDGTMAFLYGMPNWCVAIALLRGGVVEAAATFLPVTDEMFVARRGGGAFLNGVRLDLGSGLTIGAALTGIGASHRTPPEPVARVIRRLLEAGGMFYRNASGAAMLAYVAAARLAAYYEPHMYPWDAVGGLLLIEEAGGRALPYSPDGEFALGAPVLAASPAAWPQIQEIIGAGPG